MKEEESKMQEQSLDQLLEKINNKITAISPIDKEDIPVVPLYMDQLTTFMDSKLRSSLRNSTEDKVLTKTMINNYAKNHLIQPPVKKKYTKEHIMLLILIYYFKGIMSLQDIQAVLEPIGERYFHSDSGRSIDDLYSEIVRMDRDRQKTFREDVNDMVDTAADYFSDAKDEEREFLRVLAMINMLSYDVFVRKMLIEKLIDRYFHDESGDDSSDQHRE
jgi:hypothetical protein